MVPGAVILAAILVDAEGMLPPGLPEHWPAFAVVDSSVLVLAVSARESGSVTTPMVVPRRYRDRAPVP